MPPDGEWEFEDEGGQVLVKGLFHINDLEEVYDLLDGELAGEPLHIQQEVVFTDLGIIYAELPVAKKYPAISELKRAGWDSVKSFMRVS